MQVALSAKCNFFVVFSFCWGIFGLDFNLVYLLAQVSGAPNQSGRAAVDRDSGICGEISAKLLNKKKEERKSQKSPTRRELSISIIHTQKCAPQRVGGGGGVTCLPLSSLASQRVARITANLEWAKASRGWNLTAQVPTLSGSSKSILAA